MEAQRTPGSPRCSNPATLVPRWNRWEGVAALAVIALAGVGCGPPEPVQQLQTAQTAVRLPVEEWDSMIPGHVIGETRGIAEAVPLRTRESLGRFADSLPKEIDLDRQMLIYLGTPKAYERTRDAAPAMVVVTAGARDIYSPGLTVTETAMSSLISMVFPATGCCPANAAPPAEGEPDCSARWASEAAEWNGKLVLFVVPRSDGQTQVSVEQLECPN